MTPPAPVGRTAFVLGFAGLLPQVAAVLVLWFGSPVFQLVRYGLPVDVLTPLVALTYAGLILSFLGGMWWGLAMRRSDGQSWLTVLAVVPSLAALAISPPVFGLSLRTSLVMMGVVIMLTLPVDWALTRKRIAPANWMWLRVPLSLGLGGLTMLAGALVVDEVIRGISVG